MQKLVKKLLLAGMILEGSALVLGLISLLFLGPIGRLMLYPEVFIDTIHSRLFLSLLPWLLQSLIAVGMALLAFFVISAQLNEGSTSLGMEIFYIIYALALRYGFSGLGSLLILVIYGAYDVDAMAAYNYLGGIMNTISSPLSAIGLGLLLLACGAAIAVKRSASRLPGYPQPGVQNMNYPPINNYRP